MASCPECGTPIAFHGEEKVTCYGCGAELRKESNNNPHLPSESKAVLDNEEE